MHPSFQYIPQNKKNKRKSYIFFILPLCLLTLQFYIFPSGQPQPSHFLGLLLILIIWKKLPFSSISRSKPIVLFTSFTIYTIAINITYLFITFDESFSFNIIYNIFNFLLFTALIIFLVNRDDLIPKYINTPILLSLLLTVSFYLSGIGRYDFLPRYNAFFNDPNQMAHWALCCFSIICLLGVKTKKLLVGLGTLLVICIAASSRSALFGLGPILLGTITYVRKNIQKSSFITKWTFYILSFFCIIVGSHIAIESYSLEKSNSVSFLLERTESINTEEQLEERGYNLIFNYPEYIFWGAGQGGLMRFNKTTEIHSNWAGLLFYYGIIGLMLFLSCVYTMLRKLPLHLIFIAIGPLLYGFSTYGLRTPIFYFYLAALFYAYYCRLHINIKR